MRQPAWTYEGSIDCFGIDPQQRDELFARWAEHAADAGGELQIEAEDNLFDTDRYRLHATWPAIAEQFPDWVARLAALLPADHPDMVIHGRFPENLQQEDVTVRDREVMLQPYVMTPLEPVPYMAAPVELAA